MNLHHLYYFQAVAQLQSFTKASELLYVSQPTLSYAINSLEKELGISLLTRNGRSAIPTEDGKVFLNYVNSSLEKLEQGVQAISNHTSHSSHSIRILTDRLMAVLVDIKQFKGTFNCDNIDFSLKKSFGESIEDSLLSGDCDISFQTHRPTTTGLEYVQIPDSELVLLVPNNHPLANKESIDLREVDWTQNVVARYAKVPDPRAYSIAALYKQVGYDISKASSRARTTMGVASLIEAGFGIGIVPNLAHLSRFDVKVIPITYPSPIQVQYMVRKSNTPPLSAADRFFTYTAERYGKTAYTHI